MYQTVTNFNTHFGFHYSIPVLISVPPSPEVPVDCMCDKILFNKPFFNTPGNYSKAPFGEYKDCDRINELLRGKVLMAYRGYDSDGLSPLLDKMNVKVEPTQKYYFKRVIIQCDGSSGSKYGNVSSAPTVESLSDDDEVDSAETTTTEFIAMLWDDWGMAGWCPLDRFVPGNLDACDTLTAKHEWSLCGRGPGSHSCRGYLSVKKGDICHVLMWKTVTSVEDYKENIQHIVHSSVVRKGARKTALHHKSNVVINGWRYTINFSVANLCIPCVQKIQEVR